MIQRKNDESYIQYCYRLTSLAKEKEISYSQWGEGIFGDTGYGDETLRRAFRVFSLFLDKFETDNIESISDKEILEKIQMQKDELDKQRKKLQTENLQYQENKRNEARRELFEDKVIDAISRLKPIEVKKFPAISNPCNVSGVLCIYDLHAGSSYEIKGINNEIVNKYDFNEMTNRLWYLLKQMVNDYCVYDDLTIVFGGDLVENILRMSSLTKLREPVIDTVIRLGEFLSNWVAEVHNQLQVPVNVVVVSGNHDSMRILGQKAQFPEENFAKIIRELIYLRLQGHDSITVDEYTDVAIKTIRRNVIMFEHGESDPVETMNYFSNLYNIEIDEAYYGHLHRNESKTAGIGIVGDKMVYRVGSIVGVDTYAKKIRKANRASATFATYTEDGRDWAKTYYLN